MSSSLTDNKVSIFSVAAGAAADGTLTKYVSVRKYERGSLRIRWTAGAGTLVFKAYGCTDLYTTENDALAGDSGDAFQDLSVELLGAATLTGDSFILDDLGTLGTLSWIKFTAVIATSDASTALTVDLYKKEVQ